MLVQSEFLQWSNQSFCSVDYNLSFLVSFMVPLTYNTIFGYDLVLFLQVAECIVQVTLWERACPYRQQRN